MGGSSSKGSLQQGGGYAYDEPSSGGGYYTRFTSEYDEDAIAREHRFSRVRESASLSAAVETYAPHTDKLLPGGQICKFIAVWLCLFALTGCYVWLVCDIWLLRAAMSCPLIIAHLVLVALVLITLVILLARRTRRWKDEVRGRNRRPSLAGDSVVFASDYRPTEPSGILGARWGEDPSWHEGGDDGGGRRCSCREPTVRCRAALLGAAALVMFVHVGVFLFWQIVRVQIDTQSMPGGEPSTMTFSALEAEVKVEWQREGIVHIRAQSEADLFFAQGYVSSRLRLWEMEVQRHTVAGRLAEIVGERGVASDKLFRTLGLYKSARRIVDGGTPSLNVSTLVAIQAYTRGVNAYLDAMRRRERPSPFEFWALGLQPEQWKDEDSVCWLKMMAYDLGGNLQQELTRYALLAREVAQGRSDAEARRRIRQLLPPYGSECSSGDTPGECVPRTTPGTGEPYFPEVLTAIDCPKDCPPGTVIPGECCKPWLPGPGGQQTQQPQQPQARGTAEGDPTTTTARRMADSRSSHDPDNAAAVSALAELFRNRPPPPPAAGSKGDSQSSEGGLLARFGPLGWRSLWKDVLGASNNWVIAGQHTTTGKPLLANDPHLAFSAPSVWLLMHLECPTYTAIGAAFAGAPFVVIGHSSRIAWGMTNTGADVQDLYVLSPSTMGEDYYMLDGEHRAFELDEQVIKVSGGDDVPLTVRRSWWGPVVTDVLRDDHHSDYRGTDLLALNWTGIDEQIEDTTVETYHQLGSVTSWAEFRAATARFVGPSQNFVYASNENEYGQIGYVLAGWVPTRSCDNPSTCHTGQYPVPGNDTSKWAWGASIPPEQMPRSNDPAQGFLVSANNRATPLSYPLNITQDWEVGSAGYRARRITNTLKQKIESAQPISVADVQALQSNTVSELALDLQPLLQTLDAAILSQTARQWQTKMVDWDKDMTVGSREATMFAAWSVELQKLVGTTDTGSREVDGSFWHDWGFLRGAYMHNDIACGGTEQQPNNCKPKAAHALNAAAEREGSSPPRWGDDVHAAEFRAPVLGGVSLLSCLLDRAVAHGGDASSVNVGGFDAGSDSFVQSAGASYRQVVDLASLGQSQALSWFIAPAGQHGNPLSGWYDNALSLWQTGEYWRMELAGYTVQQATTMQASSADRPDEL